MASFHQNVMPRRGITGHGSQEPSDASKEKEGAGHNSAPGLEIVGEEVHLPEAQCFTQEDIGQRERGISSVHPVITDGPDHEITNKDNPGQIGTDILQEFTSYVATPASDMVARSVVGQDESRPNPNAQHVTLEDIMTCLDDLSETMGTSLKGITETLGLPSMPAHAREHVTK